MRARASVDGPAATISRVLAWCAAEGARTGASVGLPLAVALFVVVGPTAGIAVAGGWVLLLIVISLCERSWNSREASRALVHPALWIGLPVLGSLVGTIRLGATSLVRVGIIFGLPVGTYFAFESGGRWWILGAFAAWFVVLVYLSVSAARNRVIVGEFAFVANGTDGEAPAEVDVADLLRGEIARLADLLHVVGDRRAVSSGLTEQTALDATLSVDELNEAFRGAAGEESTLTIGNVTIPLRPFAHLLGKVVATARITGRLHQDGDSLILTAQTTGARRIAWRVDARRDGTPGAGRREAIVGGPMGDRWLDEVSTRGASATPIEESSAPREPEVPPRRPVVATMVRELAMRVYTDLALDQSVRWEACGHFVAGLRSFRSCLRTPKDRKVNLRGAEGEFLEALAQDEDFPLAYYNLGVVYTELLGLATAAGRLSEADMRRSAAETSFARAIEKAPQRWDCHFAFAQTQLGYNRRQETVELCLFMLRRGGLTLSEQARTRELIARALVLPLASPSDADDARNTDELYPNPAQRYRQAKRAWRESRRASELSLRALLRARSHRGTWRSTGDDRAVRSAQLASACILTYGKCYLERVLAERELAQPRPPRVPGWARWRMRCVLWALWRLGDARAELQHYYGDRCRKDDRDLTTAELQLREAAGSVPTRPDYAAALALCRVQRLRVAEAATASPIITADERADVMTPALNAIAAMTKAFFPAHDVAACTSLVEVYDDLAALPVDGIPNRADAHRFTTIARAIESAQGTIATILSDSSGSTSASGVFLQALVVPNSIDALSLVGEYGHCARKAFDRLVDGQQKRRRGAEDKAVELFEDALCQAERATSLNPLSTFAWESLGDVFAEFSDYDHAREAWNQALRTDPDNPYLYAKIGQSHWNIAFQGGARPEFSVLERAAVEFETALLLFGNDDRDQRILTHERLSKLCSALGRADAARRHLQIVASADRVPLVGWLMFAMACLQRGDFSEGEYYFRRVIKAGDELKRLPNGKPATPMSVVGDRLDERLWPLALVRAWAHVGMVLGWIERDARRPDLAEEELEKAERLLKELYGKEFEDTVGHERFPTRVRATITEARARLALFDELRLDDAIVGFEDAVSLYPYSRTYAGLADALERRARNLQPADTLRRRALLLADYAAALGPEGVVPSEAQKVRERLAGGPQTNGIP